MLLNKDPAKSDAANLELYEEWRKTVAKLPLHQLSQNPYLAMAATLNPSDLRYKVNMFPERPDPSQFPLRSLYQDL